MAKKTKPVNEIQSELIDIKKLLILKLLTEGITQSQIAGTLGIDQGNLSRMLPAKLAKAKKKTQSK